MAQLGDITRSRSVAYVDKNQKKQTPNKKQKNLQPYAPRNQPKVHHNFGVVQQPQTKPKYNLVSDITNTHNIQPQNDQNKVANKQNVQSDFIDTWLGNMGMGKYINKFKNQYNFKTKQDLKDNIKSISFLTKMGVDPEDASVIYNQVKLINIQPNGPRPVPPIKNKNNNNQAAQPEHMTKGGARAPGFIKQKEQNGQQEGAPPNQNKDEGVGALPGHMTEGGGGVRGPSYLQNKEGNGNQGQPALPGNTKGNGNTPKANAIFDDLYYFEDGYDGYYGYDDMYSFQDGYQGYDGYDGYDNQYGHYISYDNGYGDLPSFQDGYQGNGGYDKQYGHFISFGDGINDNHDSYDGLTVFAVGAFTGIILLCCICAICGGISIISYAIGTYLDKDVSKRQLKNKGMLRNDNNRCIESEIDQI